jgi:serine/threonine-protein kinase
VDLRQAAAADPDPDTAAWLGQVVADRYRLVEMIGEGGMGAVFRAEHVRIGKALAVKLLRGAFARDPDAVKRFDAEARIVSRLSHPHTIAVFDYGELGSGEGFYLAMETGRTWPRCSGSRGVSRSRAPWPSPSRSWARSPRRTGPGWSTAT